MPLLDRKNKDKMTHIQEIKSSDDTSINWFSSGIKEKKDIKPMHS